MASTTLSTTRPVIVKLRAGVNPCARFRKPRKMVRGALVDHTRRNTRGKLASTPGIFLILNFSSSFNGGPSAMIRIPVFSASAQCLVVAHHLVPILYHIDRY